MLVHIFHGTLFQNITWGNQAWEPLLSLDIEIEILILKRMEHTELRYTLKLLWKLPFIITNLQICSFLSPDKVTPMTSLEKEFLTRGVFFWLIGFFSGLSLVILPWIKLLILSLKDYFWLSLLFYWWKHFSSNELVSELSLTKKIKDASRYRGIQNRSLTEMYI